MVHILFCFLGVSLIEYVYFVILVSQRSKGRVIYICLGKKYKKCGSCIM